MPIVSPDTYQINPLVYDIASAIQNEGSATLQEFMLALAAAGFAFPGEEMVIALYTCLVTAGSC